MEMMEAAAGMAQVEARRWSSATALDPRTGNLLARTIVQTTLRIRLLALFSWHVIEEYPRVIVSNFLQQVPIDTTALRIMSLAHEWAVGYREFCD